jgi:hypothetical protein
LDIIKILGRHVLSYVYTRSHIKGLFFLVML